MPVGEIIAVIVAGLITICGLWYIIDEFISNIIDRKEVDRFLCENLDKISEIKQKIIDCDNMDDLLVVKNWAMAAIENIRYKIIDIHDMYGAQMGNSLRRNIKNMITEKEEYFIKKLLDEKESK